MFTEGLLEREREGAREEKRREEKRREKEGKIRKTTPPFKILPPNTCFHGMRLRLDAHMVGLQGQTPDAPGNTQRLLATSTPH